jgi:hypothetical protein
MKKRWKYNNELIDFAPVMGCTYEVMAQGVPIDTIGHNKGNYA